MKRFELRTGHIGVGYYDASTAKNLTLTEVLDLLNTIEEKLPPCPPKKQKIDLTPLIESGLDCEFNTGKDFIKDVHIGKLIAVNKDHAFPFQVEAECNKSLYSHCRPRMNHIHACPNGFYPCLPKGFRVKVWWKTDGDRLSITTENTSIPSGGLSHVELWKAVRYIEILGVADGWEL